MRLEAAWPVLLLATVQHSNRAMHRDDVCGQIGRQRAVQHRMVRTVLRLPYVRHNVGRQEQAKQVMLPRKLRKATLKPFQTTLSGATSIVLIAAAAISGALESFAG